MGKIANMYLDWNIMVVNGHRMVDELVARRAIDIAKEESELQQDVVRRDAPSDSIELCGELANPSSYGYYWSSSPYCGGTNGAGSLYFYSGAVNPLLNSNRALGFSVRCVRDK